MKVATNMHLKDNLPSAAAPAAAFWCILSSPTPKKILYEALEDILALPVELMLPRTVL